MRSVSFVTRPLNPPLQNLLLRAGISCRMISNASVAQLCALLLTYGRILVVSPIT